MGIKLFDEGIISSPEFDNTLEIEETKNKINVLQRQYIELHSAGELTKSNKYQLEQKLKKQNDILKALRKPIKETAENDNLFSQFSQARNKANELKNLHEEFFEAAHKKKKDQIKKQIEILEWELIETSLKEQGKQSLLPDIEHYKKSNIKPFFLWKLNFSEVFEDNGGFDVVIANPPYVSAWSMEKENPQLRSSIKKSLNNYPFLTGHWDLYVAFIAIGHKLIKEEGGLSYIVPNPILKEKYAKGVRKFLLENMIIKNILEFNDINVFEHVSRRTTVLVAIKQTKEKYEIDIFGNKETNDEIKLINSVENQLWLRLPNHLFVLHINLDEERLLNKLEEKSLRIGNYFYVNYGVQPSSKEKGKFSKRDVVSKVAKGNAKKFYEGKDIHRWSISYRNLWLDYREGELYGSRTPELFENNKIAIRKVSDTGHRIAAAFDDTKMYTDDGNVLIVPYKELRNTGAKLSFSGFEILDDLVDLKYALAFLLSSTQNFYFRNRYATESLQAATSHTYPASVRALIIKPLPMQEQNELIEVVDKILELVKKEGYTSNLIDKKKVQDYEHQIDELVYQLYSLSPGEIKLIETNTNRRKS